LAEKFYVVVYNTPHWRKEDRNEGSYELGTALVLASSNGEACNVLRQAGCVPNPGAVWRSNSSMLWEETVDDLNRQPWLYDEAREKGFAKIEFDFLSTPRVRHRRDNVWGSVRDAEEFL